MMQSKTFRLSVTNLYLITYFKFYYANSVIYSSLSLFSLSTGDSLIS
jgi:hypothetical protein